MNTHKVSQTNDHEPVPISSQKRMVLEHLRRFGSIEPLEALREYGCYRLGAVIFELRRDGMNIITQFTTSISRVTGHTVRFAHYVLQEEK